MPLLPPSSRPARFLSTLSLRRATFPGSDLVRDSQFLSTLSLRRATAGREFNVAVLKFLSTLSLRRATTIFAVRPYDAPIFLSTLSLRRATTEIWDVIAVITISIHALLAESDSRHTTTTHNDTNFYPRSPCGERRHVNAANFHLLGISIHALLAESDPFSRSGPMMRRYFYPRSPCGERREYWVGGYGTANNFYPRSPCGERQRT